MVAAPIEDGNNHLTVTASSSSEGATTVTDNSSTNNQEAAATPTTALTPTIATTLTTESGITYAKARYHLQEDLPKQTFSAVEAYLLHTKQRTIVPVFVFRMTNAKYTIIFSHGNAADIGVMFNTFEFLAKLLNANIVGYDYTGYGASIDFGKAPTEKQTYRDIETVYQWCIDLQIVINPQLQVILYGQSVGSGPTCHLARQKKMPVAGVILHSPFMSGLRVITNSRLLACFDIFPNIQHMKYITCPVWIIHGQKDLEVAFAHGQLLHESVKGMYRYEPWWVPDRGHNDVLHGNEREFIR